MSRKPVGPLLVGVGLVLLLTGASVCWRTGSASPVNGADSLGVVSVTLLVNAPGDTGRAIARWLPARDANGSADSYRVLWQSTPAGFNTLRVVGGLADTLAVALPKLGDSLLVIVTVTPVRRGIPSDSARSGQRVFKRKDFPPPPIPGFPTIDTARTR